MTSRPVPVIDLFAGPGGLGEGFSQFELSNRRRPFRIGLSIEKDETAHETLLLRSFFRQSEPESVPDAYYSFLRGEITSDRLFDQFPADTAAARNEAWHAELGKTSADLVRQRISSVVGKSNAWVLIGGPPCQAYSLVGRSRNRGKRGYRPEDDHRQFLYVEYLQIIADHWPAVFVMENVKGLLSASIDERQIFGRILDDLAAPVNALNREKRNIVSTHRRHTYRIFSIVHHGLFDGGDVRDFVVPAEHYGIPQARHRLILVGVRDDIGDLIPKLLRRCEPVAARDVLQGLPRLRSGLSREDDSPDAWRAVLQGALPPRRWLNSVRQTSGREVYDAIVTTVRNLSLPRCDRGAEFIPCEADVNYNRAWFLDPRIGGVCNHSTRGHMTGDLYRYLFAACFAREKDQSPELVDFPKDLLPNHDNVNSALDGAMFADRFRVQLANRPATTITSHISKDGHYYIHYDPAQCRSLTVREAARLQTFPDNYFFCGPRTAQYHQVGNAVPPLLAFQIADVVWDVLERAGML